MSHLSEMDGRALCYLAFPLVVRLRKSYKDGVNRDPVVQSVMVAGPQRAFSASLSSYHGVLAPEFRSW